MGLPPCKIKWIQRGPTSSSCWFIWCSPAVGSLKKSKYVHKIGFKALYIKCTLRKFFYVLWWSYIDWKCLEGSTWKEDVHLSSAMLTKKKSPNYHMTGPKAWDEKGIKRFLFSKGSTLEFFPNKKGQNRSRMIEIRWNPVGTMLKLSGCQGVWRPSTPTITVISFVFHVNMFI